MKNKIFEKFYIILLILTITLSQNLLTFAAPEPQTKKGEQKIQTHQTGKIIELNKNKMTISLATLNKEKVKELHKNKPKEKKGLLDTIKSFFVKNPTETFNLDDFFTFTNKKITIDISNANFGPPLNLNEPKIDINNKKEKPIPSSKNKIDDIKDKPKPPIKDDKKLDDK